MKRTLLIAGLILCSMFNAFAVDETELVYTNMSDFPLYGKVVQEDSCHYYRLPSSYEKTTREALWYLGKMSAGLKSP